MTSRNITIGMLRQADKSDQDKTIEEILLESCPDRDTYSKGRFDYEMEYDRILQDLVLQKMKNSGNLAVFRRRTDEDIAYKVCFLKNPDLLLLDEPTNHLDMKTVEWLEDYLINYPKAVIMVSHDRAFLDKVSTAVYELENGTLHRYAGNYTQYREQKLKTCRYSAKHMNVSRKKSPIRRN